VAHRGHALLLGDCDGLPSNIKVHTYAVDDPHDPDAALALEISGPEALESSDQPDTQPRSRLPHNSHRGSSPRVSGQGLELPAFVG
jgi:hypothetical protein